MESLTGLADASDAATVVGPNHGCEYTRKPRIVTDTLGLLPSLLVHPAGVQDRDGAVDLLRQVRQLFAFFYHAGGKQRAGRLLNA